MNILIDELPNTVKIEGIEYEINSDFRTSILFELLMQDDEINEENKILQALNLYYPKIPHNLEGAIERMLWFYRGGKEEEKEAKESNNEQIYSYEHDDDYIYSAFWSQYKIDLQEIGYFHWWKFKALFKSLGEDNEIMKIMSYRSIKISSSMSKEQKEYYTLMKKIYRLPQSRLEKLKINSIEEILLDGGDLSTILD